MVKTSDHIIEEVDTDTPAGTELRHFIEGIDSAAVCDKCGGLPYDIVITSNDTQYKFCLYKIQRGDEIIAETDYEKLYQYTRKDGPMMSSRHTKRFSAPAGI
jgi:hypothetical protein